MVTPRAEQSYYYGTGRRKTAVARVRLYPGDGTFVINGKPMTELYHRQILRETVLEPLGATGTLNKFNITVRVIGGGVSGQAGAIRHGLSRALLSVDETFKAALRKGGYLTRDPRMKERKKYGLKRARKAPQYTKR